jgi:hypothetical protein
VIEVCQLRSSGCVTASNQTFGAERANGSAGIARTLCSDSPFGAALQQIVAFSVFTAEECDAARISLVSGYVVAAPIQAFPQSSRSISIQYDTGERPVAMPYERERSSSPKTARPALADLRSWGRQRWHAEPAL